MWFEDQNSLEDSPFFNCRPPAQQLLYYSLSNLLPSGPDKPPLIFTNLEDVLEAAARNPGSKIKVFHDEISAIQYSHLHHAPQHTQTERPATGEVPLPFRAPSQQDLMKFRKTIEQGDLETFLRYLWCNPRFLVSEGDTAVILQEGFRYNALHVAVKSKQPHFCEYILSTVTSRRFLRLLYPQDSDVTLQNRIFILADQYLNTPEKGRLETPLHFAAKFGCYHCCKCLLMYHQCDKTRRNKDGQTAYNVICTRAGSPESKEKIRALFTDMLYVPLLRSPDNTLTPKVGAPCSALPTTSPDLVGPTQEMQVKAYAGPMACNLAKDFFKQWKQSPRPSKVPELNLLRQIRLTDSEKGLENYGRHLSRDFNVEWSEYWPFLDAWCNFQTHAGLAKLEAHLIETRLRVALQKKQLKNTFLNDETLNLQIGDSPFAINLKPRDFWEEHGAEIQALSKSLKLPDPLKFSLGDMEVEGGALQRALLKLVNFMFHSLPHLLAAQETSKKHKEREILKSAEGYFAEVESAILGCSKDGRFEEFSLETFHQGIASLVVASYQPQHAQSLALLLQHLLEDRFEGDVSSDTFTFHSPSSIRTRLFRKRHSPQSSDTPKSKSSKGNDMRERRRLFASDDELPPHPDPTPLCPGLGKHYWCVVRLLVLQAALSRPDNKCFCSCNLLTTLLHPAPNLPSLADKLSHLTIRPSLSTSPSSDEEEAFYTPPQSPTTQPPHQPCYLTGELPSKLDLDVRRAVNIALVTPDLYPNIHRWLEEISSFSPEETRHWASPAVRAPHHNTRLHPFRLLRSQYARQLF